MTSSVDTRLEKLETFQRVASKLEARSLAVAESLSKNTRFKKFKHFRGLIFFHLFQIVCFWTKTQLSFYASAYLQSSFLLFSAESST